MISKHSSILCHSILLVGALLPLAYSPATLPSADQFPAHSAPSPAPSSVPPMLTTNTTELVAFGRGIPASRGGGGTR